MCAKTVTPAATPATPAATPATPAAMLQALQAQQTQAVKGVFCSMLAQYFNCATPPLVLGGVQAPQRAGAITTVWCTFVHLLRGNGSTPTCAQVIGLLPNANTNNTRIEYYRVARYMQAFAAWYAAQQTPAS